MTINKKDYIDVLNMILENNPPEAKIIINGITLSYAQSLTIRVAIESFYSNLSIKGLGEDETGKRLTKNYMHRIIEIRELIMRNMK